MRTGWRATGLGLLAAAGVAACGGDSSGSNEPAADPNRPLTFRAYIQSSQALATGTAGGAAAAPLTAADVAEIGQRSRDWAVATLAPPGQQLNFNAVTVPPLYFALTHAVGSAARGDTLVALRAQVGQPSNTNVEAGLMQGVSRSVIGAPDAVLSGQFMNAISMADHPGTLQPLALQPLTAAAVASDPQLRLSIHDSVSRRWSWLQVQAFNGTFADHSGQRSNVSMLRVSGPVLQRATAEYGAVGLPLADGTWLIKITPETSMTAWGAAGLATALAELAVTFAAQPAAAAQAAATGAMVLPASNAFAAAGLDDRRGMALAMDKVNANLQGMGSGGSFLEAPAGTASLGLAVDGMTYSASQRARFEFSPSNVFGPGYGYGGGSTNVSGSFGLFPPPCPSVTADLRPSYLVLMHANGSVLLLARLATFEGPSCE